MIHLNDFVGFLAEKHGWDVRETYCSSDGIHLIWISRSDKYAVWSLSAIVDIHKNNVKLLNRYKDVNYVEADVSLYDLDSVDDLTKVLNDARLRHSTSETIST